ncbi:MAG: STAS domain-containing protein [Prochlorothrix sp.]|nr:STAS domain-containing protein [Prochlorothrix sp.]
MRLEITDLDHRILQAKLIGRMDMQGTQAIDTEFGLKLGSSLLPVLVDMSEVDFLASIGMRTLISTARGVHNRGHKLVLLNPQPLVKESLVAAGFDQLIPMYDDFEAACAALLTD